MKTSGSWPPYVRIRNVPFKQRRCEVCNMMVFCILVKFLPKPQFEHGYA